MKTHRGRPKAFDEDVVLALAMEYFWEHGYDNASLDNLLLAMGIKKSSFYHTFKSKEALFSRCLVLYREESRIHMIALEKKLGSKQAMLMLAQMTIEELQKTGKVRGCLLINSGQECYNKYPALSHQIMVEFNHMQDLFVTLIEHAQEKAEIDSAKDAKKIAGRYMNVLNGLIVTIQAGATDTLIKDIVEHLNEILG